MDYKNAIRSQYHAALEMLKQAIARCPESLWDNPGDKIRFWHVAYHALFYTHLYLQNSEKEFVPWVKHRNQSQFLGRLPWPPHDKPEIGEPYSREDILSYLEVCQEQVEERVASVNLEAESGFSWLPFSKMELQIYNIRHIQQHAGELMERLGTQANIEIDWVAMRRV
jgi:hypothetical protein